MMKKLVILVFLLMCCQLVSAQTMWQHFTAEDFAQRRTRLMEQIADGIAIFIGAELPEASIKFRQDNTFYYLSGVEVPNCMMVLDGRSKRTVLFVPEDISPDIKTEALIEPGEEAAKEYQFSRVVPRKQFTLNLAYMLATNRPVVYLYMWPHETALMSPDRAWQTRLSRMDDPWDSRLSREADFVKLFKERFPSIEVRDLSGMVHEMRWIKDEKEIAVLCKCGRIGAKGFNEAMKITRPGLFEYQIVAACDFIYQYEGQQNPAFFPIAASGERGLIWHYNANNHQVKAGDVILLDYAPDYGYYATDITRTWPVSGRFSDEQLKFYNCIKDARNNIIAAMKPDVDYEDLQQVGKQTYEKHGLGGYWFGYVGHLVGMAVHDVGSRSKAFEPGVVFNVEPIIEDKDKKLHMRLEDTVVITQDGAEVLTDGTPIEVEEIYALIKQKGLLDN